MENHLVIIGGVAAGAKAAAKARREDPDLKITIFNEGQHISYSACGLPYYIENIFDDKNRLLVRSPETFKLKDNIDVFVRHRVTKIDPQNKKVYVHNLETNEKLEVDYTKLLIATGASPIIPNIEGINLNNVFTLRSVEDSVAIKKSISSSKNAVIVGGGYIGIEMAEALNSDGLNTTIIELFPQILPQLDEDMAFQVQKYIEEEKNIKVITGDGVKRILGDNKNRVNKVETTNGQIIDTDIVLVSVGVKPNTDIAQEAGIELGSKSAIKVNNKMQTNIPDIYAAGDCVEVTNIVTNKAEWIPLGSTANKQGRIAAINITGGDETFNGVLGSLVTKIFDFTVTKTGIGEKEAKQLNYDYEVAIVPHRDRAGYMPNAQSIIIKLIGDRLTRRILGAQIVGKGDADKRINVIATAMTARMTVDEFIDTDLTYAPPYSTAIDPILMAAQVLQNKLNKKAESISTQELKGYLEKNKECCLIDVRELEEFQKGHYTQARNIPFDEIDLEEIKKNPEQKVVVYCEQGMRGYLTSLKLKNAGIKDVKYLDGGICTCSERLKQK